MRKGGRSPTRRQNIDKGIPGQARNDDPGNRYPGMTACDVWIVILNEVKDLLRRWLKIILPAATGRN